MKRKSTQPKGTSRGWPSQCAVRPRRIYAVCPPIVDEEINCRVFWNRGSRPVTPDEGQNAAFFVEILLVPLENGIHDQGLSVLLELHHRPPVDGRRRHLRVNNSSKAGVPTASTACYIDQSENAQYRKTKCQVFVLTNNAIKTAFVSVPRRAQHRGHRQ